MDAPEDLRLDPEIAAVLARLAEAVPPLPATANWAERRARNRREHAWYAAGTPQVPTAEATVELAGRAVRLRRHGPADAGRVVLYVHGGGWCLGDIGSQEGLMRTLAAASGLAVVAIEYALAPEHPFPQALDEVGAAARRLAAGGFEGRSPRDLVLAGDSSGANLALAAALDLRAERLPIAGLALVYGVFDDDLDTPSHRLCGDGRFGLSTAEMAAFWASYAPDPAARTARTCPLRADLAGLPPAFVLGAALDCLRDDSRRLAGALAGAGVAVTFEEVRGAPHAFLKMTQAPAAAGAIGRLADFVQRLP